MFLPNDSTLLLFLARDWSVLDSFKDRNNPHTNSPNSTSKQAVTKDINTADNEIDFDPKRLFCKAQAYTSACYIIVNAGWCQMVSCPWPKTYFTETFLEN